ncbi:hypothetical protein ACFXJ8_39710 [Nonomuraea sp. NPDC059194]|uniref:hypothetical protein n=1 Tax=Nonomuraea sp. NPDC059194 TaxID=3346764 RepID=UPI0036CB8A78
MRTGRANRVGLAILGLILLVVGGLTLARGLRVLPQSWAPADEPLLDPTVTGFFGTFSPWIWWALAVLAVIVALAGLRWLVAQGRTESTRDVNVDGGADGRTTVAARAAASAVSAELSALPSVRAASARLAGDKDLLWLRLRVAADDRVPISVLRHELTTVTVPHLQQTLGADRLPTVAQVDLERAAPPKRVLQ